ncbi:MAG: EamA family transporter [Minisyncoccia bacterium]
MWLAYALGASVFWGMSYVISEHIYKHISVLSGIAAILFVSGLILGLVSLFTGALSKDAAIILSSSRVAGLLVAGIVLLTIAELCIGFSIAHKNATIAGLIEISYPIFIALFSYLLFSENNLNFATVMGAILIFSGAGVIYAFNR